MSTLRVPAGVPTGGQFAARSRSEAEVELGEDGQTERPPVKLAQYRPSVPPQVASAQEVENRLRKVYRRANRIVDDLTAAGIGVTYPDGGRGKCCASCVQANVERDRGERGGWVGFNEQDLADSALVGSMRLHHDLQDPDDRRLVVEVLSKRFDVNWDGSDEQCIKVTFPGVGSVWKDTEAQ